MATATLERKTEIESALTAAVAATGLMNVYQCIAAVSKAIAKEGISKARSNQQQGYKFRGIDDVHNTLAPMLADAGLVILPRCLSRDVVERQTKAGNALFYVTVEMEYDFVSAWDSSKHPVRVFGEAMDSADKATNKAMSAAYKYAAIQTFCIPTEGDNDADATTHDVQAPAPQAAVQPRRMEERENAAVPTAGGIGHLGTLITDVEETTIPSGKMAGKPKWWVHFENGEKAQTISSQVASKAQQLHAAGTRVQAELKKTNWGVDLMALFPVPAAMPERQLNADMEAHTEPVDADSIPF